MEPRFIQAHKEARLALWLTLTYMALWYLTAYFPDSQPGITGLPRWFELACLVVPVLFIVLCWLMVKFLFKDMSLEDENAC